LTEPVRPFHLAFAVHNLAATRAFYGDVLGCAMGRSAETWQDFDLFGHQLSAHLDGSREVGDGSGAVDGRAVPVPHFGVVLDMEAWEALAARLRAHAVPFVVEPEIRFRGKPGEQGTFFVCDPSGNALEFKGVRRLEDVFATDAPAAVSPGP